MLTEIIDFFRREKLYAALFAVLCLFYGFLVVSRGKEAKDPEKTQILESFKKAEDQTQAKIKKMGSMESYLKDRPDLLVWVNVFSLIFIFALGGGIWIDYLLLSKPGFRSSLELPRPPPLVDWKSSYLFKFFIWFFTANIGISILLGGLQRYVYQNENFYILFHTTCAELVSFFVILWIIRRNGGNISDIGLSLPDGKWFREMRFGWAAYLAILPLFGVVLLVLLSLTELFHYEPPPHPLVPIFLEEGGHSQGMIIYSLILAAFVGPLFEEIFFRGFCYPVLKRRFGTLAAMTISSSFFAFIHDSTFAFWPIFVLGMALNYIYEKRGSLVANITLHVTHNFLFLSYFFLAKSIISREMGG